MDRRIDLNADLGEGYGPWSMGDDRAMLDVVTSANVACGGHAGDAEIMYATALAATERGVVLGAHPGYADRAGFGRRIIPMSHGEISRMIAAQIGAFRAVAALAGTDIRYVKIHGALANLAARDRDVAHAVAEAVAGIDPTLALLAISGTELDSVADEHGLTAYAEIFADRGYQPNGQLVPRGTDGAMLHDPAEATERLLGFLETGEMPAVGGPPVPLDAHSICVHGDSPGAVTMATELRTRLAAEGVDITSFLEPG